MRPTERFGTFRTTSGGPDKELELLPPLLLVPVADTTEVGGVEGAVDALVAPGIGVASAEVADWAATSCILKGAKKIQANEANNERGGSMAKTKVKEIKECDRKGQRLESEARCALQKPAHRDRGSHRVGI